MYRSAISVNNCSRSCALARDFAFNDSDERWADIALDACQCLFKGVRWMTLEIDSVEVRLEGSLIWWDPEAFGLDGIERQQVRLLLALVCDRKGVQVTIRHVMMAPSDHGENSGCPASDGRGRGGER